MESCNDNSSIMSAVNSLIFNYYVCIPYSITIIFSKQSVCTNINGIITIQKHKCKTTNKWSNYLHVKNKIIFLKVIKATFLS